MNTLLKFSRWIDRSNDAIGATVRWLTLIMVVVGSFNAIARYTTRWTGVSLSSNAYIDLQWYLFSLVFLLGAAYGLNHDVHVRVDVLYERMNERARAWIDLLGTVLFLLPFCVVMVWVSVPAVRASWAIREASADPGGLARYPIKTIVPIAFVLLLAQGVSQLVEQVAVIRGVPTADGEPAEDGA